MRAYDSGSKVEIVIDGRRVTVPAGITIAAALFNHGVTTLRQSVSDSPRGVLCGMGVCFECRVTIDGVAHQRACLVPVTNGIHIATHGKT